MSRETHISDQIVKLLTREVALVQGRKPTLLAQIGYCSFKFTTRGSKELKQNKIFPDKEKWSYDAPLTALYH
jgi:hypothetical protein